MLTVKKQHTGTGANALEIDALLSKGLVGMREASRINTYQPNYQPTKPLTYQATNLPTYQPTYQPTPGSFPKADSERSFQTAQA